MDLSGFLHSGGTGDEPRGGTGTGAVGFNLFFAASRSAFVVPGGNSPPTSRGRRRRVCLLICLT